MAVFTIRVAEPSDIPLLAEYLTAMAGAIGAIGGYPVRPEDEMRQSYTSRLQTTTQKTDMVYLIAECDGKPAGMLEASAVQLSGVFCPQTILHIHSVYVAPDYRRRGIARELIAHGLQWGRDHGCATVELDVLANNPAQQLYRALGFDIVEHRMVRPL